MIWKKKKKMHQTPSDSNNALYYIKINAYEIIPTNGKGKKKWRSFEQTK